MTNLKSSDELGRENTIWTGHPEWAGFVVPLALFSFLFLISLIVVFTGELIPFAVSGSLLAIVAVYRISFEFMVTDRRIIVKRSILSFSSNEIEIKDIREIAVIQGPIQRLFKIGHIQFTTAAGIAKSVSLVYIKNPELLKEKILNFKAAQKE
jgi:uncharacterized membrane protein YdbT with pleckstrin-like domain